MKSDQYVKYLTEQFVRYMETPRAERRERKVHRPPTGNLLFGQIPIAIESYIRRAQQVLSRRRK